MYSSTSDLRCPSCRSVDRVVMASSRRDKVQLPRRSTRGTQTPPLGAFMLAFLLASLPFLTGSVYDYLTSWPAELSAANALMPRPLVSGAIAAAVLLAALDRPTRTHLLRLGRAARLDSGLYQDLDSRGSPHSSWKMPVAVAGLGWAVLLGLEPLDSWWAMSREQTLSGPHWLPATAQGFLAGGLVVLAGLPLMAFTMTRFARLFAEYGIFDTEASSFAAFARNLAYPYLLLTLGMGLVVSSGLQLLMVPAICWFLAAMFVATLHTTKQGTDLAVPVALLGAVPVILSFFFVILFVEMTMVNASWDRRPGQISSLPDLETAWLVGSLVLAGLLALIALLAGASARRRNASTDPSRRQSTAPWAHLLYCERCDGVHLPDQKEFVPAREAGRLLPATRPDG